MEIANPLVVHLWQFTLQWKRLLKFEYDRVSHCNITQAVLNADRVDIYVDPTVEDFGLQFQFLR